MPGGGGCCRVTLGSGPMQGERNKVQQCMDRRTYNLDFLYGDECDSDFAPVGVVSHKVQVMRLDFLGEIIIFVFIYVISDFS